MINDEVMKQGEKGEDPGMVEVDFAAIWAALGQPSESAVQMPDDSASPPTDTSPSPVATDQVSADEAQTVLVAIEEAITSLQADLAAARTFPEFQALSEKLNQTRALIEKSAISDEKRAACIKKLDLIQKEVIVDPEIIIVRDEVLKILAKIQNNEVLYSPVEISLFNSLGRRLLKLNQSLEIHDGKPGYESTKKLLRTTLKSHDDIRTKFEDEWSLPINEYITLKLPVITAAEDEVRSLFRELKIFLEETKNNSQLKPLPRNSDTQRVLNPLHLQLSEINGRLTSESDRSNVEALIVRNDAVYGTISSILSLYEQEEKLLAVVNGKDTTTSWSVSSATTTLKQARETFQEDVLANFGPVEPSVSVARHMDEVLGAKTALTKNPDDSWVIDVTTVDKSKINEFYQECKSRTTQVIELMKKKYPNLKTAESIQDELIADYQLLLQLQKAFSNSYKVAVSSGVLNEPNIAIPIYELIEVLINRLELARRAEDANQFTEILNQAYQGILPSIDDFLAREDARKQAISQAPAVADDLAPVPSPAEKLNQPFEIAIPHENVTDEERIKFLEKAMTEGNDVLEAFENKYRSTVLSSMQDALNDFPRIFFISEIFIREIKAKVNIYKNLVPTYDASAINKLGGKLLILRNNLSGKITEQAHLFKGYEDAAAHRDRAQKEQEALLDGAGEPAPLVEANAVVPILPEIVLPVSADVLDSKHLPQIPNDSEIASIINEVSVLLEGLKIISRDDGKTREQVLQDKVRLQELLDNQQVYSILPGRVKAIESLLGHINSILERSPAPRKEISKMTEKEIELVITLCEEVLFNSETSASDLLISFEKIRRVNNEIVRLLEETTRDNPQEIIPWNVQTAAEWCQKIISINQRFFRDRYMNLPQSLRGKIDETKEHFPLKDIHSVGADIPLGTNVVAARTDSLGNPMPAPGVSYPQSKDQNAEPVVSRKDAQLYINEAFKLHEKLKGSTWLTAKDHDDLVAAQKSVNLILDTARSSINEQHRKAINSISGQISTLLKRSEPIELTNGESIFQIRSRINYIRDTVKNYRGQDTKIDPDDEELIEHLIVDLGRLTSNEKALRGIQAYTVEYHLVVKYIKILGKKLGIDVSEDLKDAIIAPVAPAFTSISDVVKSVRDSVKRGGNWLTSREPIVETRKSIDKVIPGEPWLEIAKDFDLRKDENRKLFLSEMKNGFIRDGKVIAKNIASIKERITFEEKIDVKLGFFPSAGDVIEYFSRERHLQPSIHETVEQGIAMNLPIWRQAMVTIERSLDSKTQEIQPSVLMNAAKYLEHVVDTHSARIDATNQLHVELVKIKGRITRVEGRIITVAEDQGKLKDVTAFQGYDYTNFIREYVYLEDRIESNIAELESQKEEALKEASTFKVWYTRLAREYVRAGEKAKRKGVDPETDTLVLKAESLSSGIKQGQIDRLGITNEELDALFKQARMDVVENSKVANLIQPKTESQNAPDPVGNVLERIDVEPIMKVAETIDTVLHRVREIASRMPKMDELVRNLTSKETITTEQMQRLKSLKEQFASAKMKALEMTIEIAEYVRKSDPEEGIALDDDFKTRFIDTYITYQNDVIAFVAGGAFDIMKEDEQRKELKLLYESLLVITSVGVKLPETAGSVKIEELSENDLLVKAVDLRRDLSQDDVISEEKQVEYTDTFIAYQRYAVDKLKDENTSDAQKTQIKDTLKNLNILFIGKGIALRK